MVTIPFKRKERSINCLSMMISEKELISPAYVILVHPEEFTMKAFESISVLALLSTTQLLKQWTAVPRWAMTQRLLSTSLCLMHVRDAEIQIIDGPDNNIIFDLPVPPSPSFTWGR